MATPPAADAFRSINELPLQGDRTEGWGVLRSAGGVVLADDGTYVLAAASAVEQAATAPEVFSSKSAFDRLGSPLTLIPIAVDPPEHTRYRKILDNFFGPRRMAAIEPELRRQVGALVDEVASRESCDVVADLAVPYPSQVFLTLFGLPLADRDRLVRWKDSILEVTDPASSEPTPEVLQHAGELYLYLTHHIGDRRSAGEDGAAGDLLSQLLATRDEGGLTDEEILGLCFLFVVAGLDTVTAAVGFAFRLLASDSARRRAITEDPSRIPDFVEELLRIEGPVPFAPRVTSRDAEIDGVSIPAGSSCMLGYGAANRDPQRYDDADTVGDRRAAHFAFGRGPHRCLGSHLARLELRLVLEEWHRRIPEYTLGPGSAPRAHWPAGTLALDRVELTLPGGARADGRTP